MGSCRADRAWRPAAARSRDPVRADGRRAGACRARGIDAADDAFGRERTRTGRRFLRPSGAQRDRHRGHRTGARGAVTARESLAQRLTKARDRTLRLVEFDDAEMHRQYDPLMSPLVWDLAHIGWQEELWLLRGNDPSQPGLLEPQVERCYDAFVNSPASR